MTVTYFTGKNTKSVSPSTHKQKGKKKESKLGRQGPAVFRHRHVRQPHSMLLVLKDIHSRKTPSRLGPLTNRLPFPSPPPTQILMLFSFSGSSLVGSHSPQKLSSIVCSQRGSAWAQVLLPPPVGFSPNPLIHTRGFLLKNDFRVCSPGRQGPTSCCTLAGRLGVKTL